MDAEEFLTNYIEGYLFSDLEQMSRLKPLPNGMGAAGYPMVGTIISGMSLLGALTQYGYKGESKWAAFEHYWTIFLSPNLPRYTRQAAEIVHSLARHGIAHTSLAGVGISVTKSSPGDHLKATDGRVNIDAVQFYLDFRQSYETSYKPAILNQGSLLTLVNSNIAIFLQTSAADAAKAMGQNTQSGISITSTPLSATNSSGVVNPAISRKTIDTLMSDVTSESRTGGPSTTSTTTMTQFSRTERDHDDAGGIKA